MTRIRAICLWSMGLMGLAIFAGSAGCQKEMLTKERFELITPNSSTKTDVENTLGKKYVDRGNEWEYEDMDRKLSVYVHFNNRGVVTRKEWVDASTGEWTGAHPDIDENTEGEPGMHQEHSHTVDQD